MDQQNTKKIEHKYVCDTCKEPFSKAAHLEYHKNKKNKCSPRDECDKILPSTECICGKVYSRTDSLANHKKNCSVIKQKQKMNNNAKIESMNTVHNMTGTINNNINSNNVLINNPIININVYDMILFPYTRHLDMSNMTAHEQHQILHSGQNPYITYFELMNCNPIRPYFHNMYYPDKNSEKMLVFTGTEWLRTPTGKIIHEILKKERQSFIDYVDDTYYLMDADVRKNMIYHINSIDFISQKLATGREKCAKNMIKIQDTMTSILHVSRSIHEKTFGIFVVLCKSPNFLDTVKSEKQNKARLKSTISRVSDSTDSDSTESSDSLSLPIKKIHIRKKNYESDTEIDIDNIEFDTISNDNSSIDNDQYSISTEDKSSVISTKKNRKSTHRKKKNNILAKKSGRAKTKK